MKKLLFLSILFLANFTRGQWAEQFSDSLQYYNTIFFIDSLKGWVGGYIYDGNSFIIKTTDGGKNWDESQIGSVPSSIYFTNSNIGFCAAYNGIYKSSDGGNSWELNYSDTIHYNSIKFIDENNGWAVGDNTKNIYILKTDNGGTSWTKSFIAAGVEPHLDIINDSTVFVTSGDSTKIWKSIDGGNNWNTVFSDTILGYNGLWDINFIDELHGYACGFALLKTTDGGNRWEKSSLPLLIATNVFSINNQCWVSGFGVGYNCILHSDDYANTWTPVFVDDSSQINDIYFSDINDGWYCSNKFTGAPFYNGFIYKIKKDWRTEISPPQTPKQIYPPNNSFVKQIFNFEWEKFNYSLYRLQVSYDSLFNNLYAVTHYQTGDTLLLGNKLYVENNPQYSLPPNSKFYWRVRGENSLGVSDWSETWSFTTPFTLDVKDKNVLSDFKLYQNYPNPFNPSTKIKYSILSVETGHAPSVQLLVYDVLGRKVATLVNKQQRPGNYEVEFNSNVGANNYSPLPSGIYFYQLKAGNFIQTKKMILMK